MGRDFYIKDNDIIANISYFNVTENYRIGLHIGQIYTILNNKFTSEKEAISYLYDNFEYVHEMKQYW